MYQVLNTNKGICRLRDMDYIENEIQWIQLKPLSSISDEDADLVGYYNMFSCNDELRQLGYATPQTVIEDGKVVTYSVEELVSNGVFKLD